MSETLLEVKQLTKRFGGFTALENISFSIAAGERLALIGPNGSGKSTTVNCIAGFFKPDHGEVKFNGEVLNAIPPHGRIRLGIARTFQIPKPFASMTVLENIEIPLIYANRTKERLADKVSRLAYAMDILDSVGLGDKAGALSSSLTQVDMRKLELARAIAASPKLLIADEVMLSLKDRGIAVLLIEHIMRAVMSFSDRVIVFVAGKKIADDVPSVVINNPEVVRAYLGE